MRKLLIIFCLLLCCTLINRHDFIARAATWDFVSEIEDGAVYFIKSALDSNKITNIPNGNISDNKKLHYNKIMKLHYNMNLI